MAQPELTRPGPGGSRIDGSVNREVAQQLREVADLLEQQRGNRFRITAYRQAADTVDRLEEDLGALFHREGTDGLMALPGIGPGISAAITQMLRTGNWPLLERLRGGADPVELFQTLPGLGPELARRIHDTLGVDSLEALEDAAHDGRLARVDGMGQRRVQAIRVALDSLLGRRHLRHRRGGPSVAMLLDIDREYREEAHAGRLPTIAPRRFNPDGASWLPVLHSQRGPWHFTALYSNTALAHQLGRTRDWVVLFYYDDQHREQQCTVVTETRGPLKGERVVRGREAECRALHEV